MTCPNGTNLHTIPLMLCTVCSGYLWNSLKVFFKVAGKLHTSAIIVSGLRPPLYSWFFFLNEANHCSSCFSSLISKSYLAVQPYYKRQKHEGNPEKFLCRRLPYINGHTHREGQGYIFSGRFVNQVNNFSNSLYYKQLLQWLVEGVT